MRSTRNERTSWRRWHQPTTSHAPSRYTIAYGSTSRCDTMPGRRGLVRQRHALAQAGRGLERRVDLAELRAATAAPAARGSARAPCGASRGPRELRRRVGQLGQIERELLEREVDDLRIRAAGHRVRDRRGEHERRDLVGRQPDLGHLEPLEIDHVAAVLERVVLVGRDVADRHAEIEQVRLVALERAQAGLDVERLVARGTARGSRDTSPASARAAGSSRDRAGACCDRRACPRRRAFLAWLCRPSPWST